MDQPMTFPTSIAAAAKSAEERLGKLSEAELWDALQQTRANADAVPVAFAVVADRMHTVCDIALVRLVRQTPPLPKNVDEFDEVVCLWQWSEEPKPEWQFVESYPVTADGFPIGATKRAVQSRDSYTGFTTQPAEPRNAGDPDDEEVREPVPGRMVTSWCYERGIQIYVCHPPSPQRTWQAQKFDLSSPNPFNQLRGGWHIKQKTAKEARRIVEWMARGQTEPETPTHAYFAVLPVADNGSTVLYGPYGEAKLREQVARELCGPDGDVQVIRLDVVGGNLKLIAGSRPSPAEKPNPSPPAPQVVQAHYFLWIGTERIVTFGPYGSAEARNGRMAEEQRHQNSQERVLRLDITDGVPFFDSPHAKAHKAKLTPEPTREA